MRSPIPFLNLCYYSLKGIAHFAKASWRSYVKRGVVLRPIKCLSKTIGDSYSLAHSLFPLLQSLSFELPAYSEGIGPRIRLQHGARSRSCPLQQDKCSRCPLQDARISSQHASLPSKQMDAAVLRHTREGGLGRNSRGYYILSR